MDFTFCSNISQEGANRDEVISGEFSIGYKAIEYLMAHDGEQERHFKIHYQYHCSPFKEAAVLSGKLLVGHEEHFYLYDLEKRQSILVLKLEGYFSHLYIDEEFIYIADANGVYKISQMGNVLWHNDNLAIDGVLIERFTDAEILGRGECDPPGGWREFVLDKATGVTL